MLLIVILDFINNIYIDRVLSLIGSEFICYTYNLLVATITLIIIKFVWFLIGSVGVKVASELGEVKEKIESSPFETYDLTKNELVKDHLRYMMGGRSNVPNEVFYRFILPQRSGALLQFLYAFGLR
ncbi:hypothetical protein IC575_019323 [Cucumis melo]